MNEVAQRRFRPFLNLRPRGALLHVVAMLFAIATLFPSAQQSARADTTCTSGVIVITCPTTFPPPDLLNLNLLEGGGDPLYSATPAQIRSLQHLESQAVTTTIADHGLASGDNNAVQSWGRDDADAELYALLVQAIKANPRTTDQQNAVDWLTAMEQRQTERAAQDAGLQYVKWAGLDQTAYTNLLATNPSESTLQTFLSPQPLNFGNGGGYCNYRSPAPDASEYTGYTDQTCFTPCTSVLGCSPPTPSYDQFVKWGEDQANYQFLNSSQFAQQLHNIAIGIGFGLAAGAGVAGLAVGTAAVLSSASAGAAASFLFPCADALAVTVAGVAALVVIVVLAIVIAVIAAINLFNALALPGQLAQLIVGATTTPPDVTTIVNDPSQETGLYSLFVGATLPAPTNQTCDNSAILVISDTLPPPCLNPTAIPSATNNDPVFAVQAQGSSATSYANSITWVDDATTPTSTTARLSGHWFIEQVTQGGATSAVQSLRMAYTDWNGKEQNAWLIQDVTGAYQFLEFSVPAGTSTTVDSTNCITKSVCNLSPTIEYVGADGKDYSASVLVTAPTVSPTTSANPTEGSQVSFSANGTSPIGLPVTYQWQFEQPSAGFIYPNYNYTAPVTGTTATYAWATSGTFHVQLTATDSLGKQTVDTFTVSVADVPPKLTLWPAVPPPSQDPLGLFCAVNFCDQHIVPLGTATTIHGAVIHTGSLDTETVSVNWGDGSAVDVNALGGDIIYLDSNISLTASTSTAIALSATHTYSSPGNYTVTIQVIDQGGGTVTTTTVENVQDHTAVTWPAPQPIVYGTALSSLQLDATASSPGTASVPGTFAYSADSTPVTATEVLPAGLHTLTVQFTPSDPTLYTTPAAVTVPLTVTQAPLTVTPDDQQITYGDALPAFSWKVGPFVNGDSIASLTTQPTCSSTTAGSPAGTYPITCTGAADPNYLISYNPGTLTIRRSPTTLSLTAPAALNLGQSLPITATVTPVFGIAPSGTVTYTLTDTRGNNTVVYGTVSDGRVVVSVSNLLPSQTYHVAAAYSGDGNYLPSSTGLVGTVYQRGCTVSGNVLQAGVGFLSIQHLQAPAVSGARVLGMVGGVLTLNQPLLTACSASGPIHTAQITGLAGGGNHRFPAGTAMTVQLQTAANGQDTVVISGNGQRVTLSGAATASPTRLTISAT